MLHLDSIHRSNLQAGGSLLPTSSRWSAARTRAACRHPPYLGRA